MADPLILLVEDDPKAREGYAEFLQHGGFQVAQAGSAFEATVDIFLHAGLITKRHAYEDVIAPPPA